MPLVNFWPKLDQLTASVLPNCYIIKWPINIQVTAALVGANYSCIGSVSNLFEMNGFIFQCNWLWRWSYSDGNKRNDTRSNGIRHFSLVRYVIFRDHNQVRMKYISTCDDIKTIPYLPQEENFIDKFSTFSRIYQLHGNFSICIIGYWNNSNEGPHAQSEVSDSWNIRWISLLYVGYNVSCGSTDVVQQ